jgi:beta-N-acetylhexosaminidase
MMLGPLMLDLEGLVLTPEERVLILNPSVGGIIFFSRNFVSYSQLVALVADIRAIRGDLLLCVDQEGGRVQRFRDGFTHLPPMQMLGDLLLKEEGGESLLQDAGWLMASELLACGLDFSFAPVLDLDRESCAVIGDRSFADNPEQAIRAAHHFITGMHQAGMAATGKHFPGHGGVVADSHHETPYDNRTLQQLRDRDLQPFALLAGELDAIMPAHIVYSCVEAVPVGFSPIWLQKILRDELQFQGVIFSDDLSMKGADLVGGYPEKASRALQAGCDMVLVCNNRAGALEVIDFLSENPVKPSGRLAKMAARKHPEWEALRASERWQITSQKLAKQLNKS